MGLGFGMVVMTMVMVMRSRGQRRSGEHQDKEHGSKDLLHGVNVARCELWKSELRQHESSEQTPRPNMRAIR